MKLTTIGPLWEHGGPQPPDGACWVWLEASSTGGGHPEDPPEYPDTRLFMAPEKLSKQLVAQHNALVKACTAALKRIESDYEGSDGEDLAGGLRALLETALESEVLP